MPPAPKHAIVRPIVALADACRLAMRDVGLSSRSFIIAWTLASIATALWPLFAFSDPGLQDYPNHLARAFILLHPHDTILGRNYRVEWSTIPDLGWDLWVIALGPFLPLEWVGKLFIATSFTITMGGCFVVNRVIVGRWTALPLLAFPFLFNATYAMGFLAFDLGFGLALWAMAWWLWVPDRCWRLRLSVATALATVLYVAHLYAWAIYGIFVLGLEIEKIAAAKTGRARATAMAQTLRDGLQTIPALLLFGSALINAPAGTTADREIAGFGMPYVRVADVARLVDVGPIYLNVIMVCLVSVAVIVPLRRGWVRFDRRVAIPLLLFTVLFLAVPNEIFGTYYVALRMPVAIVFVAVAAMSPVQGFEHRFASARVGIMAIVLIMIASVQGASWRASQDEKNAFLTLIDDVPPGSRLFWAHSGITKQDVADHERGAYHVGSYAVLAKRMLVQSMFASRGQQPLRIRDVDLARNSSAKTFLSDIAKDFPTPEGFRTHVMRFDYVVMHGVDDAPERALLPMNRLRLLRRTGDFRLYQVMKTRVSFATHDIMG